MRQASEAEGKRLLDVLDVHWYPEARGDDIRITDQVGTNETRKARLQAPRTLWDPTYIEDSWIGQWGSHHLPLLPTLQQSIDTYYPGTKLAITEFNYGAQMRSPAASPWSMCSASSASTMFTCPILAV